MALATDCSYSVDYEYRFGGGTAEYEPCTGAGSGHIRLWVGMCSDHRYSTYKIRGGLAENCCADIMLLRIMMT